ncbi:MAG: hypothetical protein FWH08_03130 [Oscillospiraceae bacterium]|nr:hypothetical protein [Oscillospiraceae bacterium]
MQNSDEYSSSEDILQTEETNFDVAPDLDDFEDTVTEVFSKINDLYCYDESHSVDSHISAFSEIMMEVIRIEETLSQVVNSGGIDTSNIIIGIVAIVSAVAAFRSKFQKNPKSDKLSLTESGFTCKTPDKQNPLCRRCGFNLKSKS